MTRKDKIRRARGEGRKAERMNILAPLFKKGYAYREMRQEVMLRLDLKTYSLQTVKSDIDSMLKEWQSQRVDNLDANIQLELVRIDDIIREAWEAWEKSKQDYQQQKLRREGAPTDGENTDSGVEIMKIVQIRSEITVCGDPRYLDIISKQLVERRKILGLYAPEKHLSQCNNKIIIDQTKSMSMEQLEEEINRLRKLDK